MKSRYILLAVPRSSLLNWPRYRPAARHRVTIGAGKGVGIGLVGVVLAVSTLPVDW